MIKLPKIYKKIGSYRMFNKAESEAFRLVISLLETIRPKKYVSDKYLDNAREARRIIKILENNKILNK